jgi:thiol-disulfide isomerase/thioredoxin
MTSQDMDTGTVLQGRLAEKDLARFVWFEEGKQRYTPDSNAVEALRPFAPQLRFVVVMGTWCSDSRKHVPAFYKLASALHIPDRQIDLIGVDRQKSCSAVDIAPLDIRYVPTIIVIHEGREVGRIVENPRGSLEKDLLEILRHPPEPEDEQLHT